MRQAMIAATKTSHRGHHEELFAFVAAGLRKLKPLRKHPTVLLETALNPLAATPDEEGQSLRLSHLETVARLFRKRGVGELSPVALQLYWTLYTGVLMFWAQDRRRSMKTHWRSSTNRWRCSWASCNVRVTTSPRADEKEGQSHVAINKRTDAGPA